jgi:two-component system phosphate regulon response regulator OmpR
MPPEAAAIPAEAPHLLVVDDDARLRELLARFLKGEGFRVDTAGDAAAAREKLAVLAFDLLVLDVGLPGESGLQLAQSLRQGEREIGVPILILTARGAPDDRIAGFEAGADDYLPKPFDPRELSLRIRALLRRTAPPPAPQPAGAVALGEMTFDIGRGELRRGGERVHLTEGEAALLTALARRAGEVLSREFLAEQMGPQGAPGIGDRAVDVAVVRLRRKLEPDPREPRWLQTVRGVGYVLKPGA